MQLKLKQRSALPTLLLFCLPTKTQQTVIEVNLDDRVATFPVDTTLEDYGAGEWCRVVAPKADVASCASTLVEAVPRVLAARAEGRPQSLTDGTATSWLHSGPGGLLEGEGRCTDEYHVGGRCMLIRSLLRYVLVGKVPGDYVEAGTHIGDSAAMAAQVFKQNFSPKRIWLYDSFEGMPEAVGSLDGALAVGLSPGDMQPGWGHEATAVGVAERLARVTGDPAIATVVPRHSGGRGANDEGHMVTIREGWFNETFTSTPRPGNHSGAVAFLMVDCDWYGSVLETLEQFYDAVPPGGIIALDDFGYWEGARRALGDFIIARSRQPGKAIDFPLFERYGPDFLWWIKGHEHNRPAGSNGERGW